MSEISIEQLEAAASHRWGDAWTIRTLRFADGSAEHYAYHTYGKSDGLVERGRLVPSGDGSIEFQRVLLTPMTVNETVEHKPGAKHVSEAD